MEHATRGAFAGGSRLLERGTREQIRLVWRLFRDDRVSPLKFAIPVLLFLYIVSPVDAIPDVLLGIGQGDDLGVAIAALVLMIRVIPKLAPGQVVKDHLRDMRGRRRDWEPRTESGDGVIDAHFSIRR